MDQVLRLELCAHNILNWATEVGQSHHEQRVCEHSIPCEPAAQDE